MLPVCHAFWIGRRLGDLHAACLRSFGEAGQQLVLHVYDKPEDVPDNVVLANASHLIPRSQIYRHRSSGSFAPFSDRFRYAILRAGLGVYVDCDVYCVRPIEDGEYLFCWEGGVLNNAVLKLPANSPLLGDLLAAVNNPRFVPPWVAARRRLKWRLRSLVGLHHSSHLPVATFGPAALTYYVRARGLDHLALPSEVYYPVHYKQMAEAMLTPGRVLEDVVSPGTTAFHLHNRHLPHSLSDVPAGSVLSQLMTRRHPRHLASRTMKSSVP